VENAHLKAELADTKRTLKATEATLKKTQSQSFVFEQERNSLLREGRDYQNTMKLASLEIGECQRELKGVQKENAGLRSGYIQDLNH